MRHDYDLPPEWPSMSDQERHEWLLRERCMRQALQQDTAGAEHLEEAQARYKRRVNARAGRLDLEANR